MKLTASFEDGSLHILLAPETEAEQRMVGAVIDQPQDGRGDGYMDGALVTTSMRYEGHWTNKRVSSLRMSVYRPNKPSQS